MVSMSAALLRASNTIKNTIDDADYIIDWIYLIHIIQCVKNPPPLPLDCKLAIFIFYIQWFIFLLIRNTMRNTMLRNFFKKVSFFHKFVSTEYLIRTLFQEDTQVDGGGQACV